MEGGGCGLLEEGGPNGMETYWPGFFSPPPERRIWVMRILVPIEW